MAFILTINTGFETASVILSSGAEIIAEQQNTNQKSHASFLEPAIKRIFTESRFNLNTIDAISVVNGPGSYTGLRIGLASAKALSYALNKPLILLNSLDVMAHAIKLQFNKIGNGFLFCPLIDARRMEVFTALYDENLNLIKTYFSEIINDEFLKKELQDKTIVAGGSGSFKLQQTASNEQFIYVNPLNLSKPAVILSNKAFNSQNFSNLIYSEPFYLKPVYFKK